MCRARVFIGQKYDQIEHQLGRKKGGAGESRTVAVGTCMLSKKNQEAGKTRTNQ